MVWEILLTIYFIANPSGRTVCTPLSTLSDLLKLLLVSNMVTVLALAKVFITVLSLRITVYSRIESAPFLQFQRAKKLDAD
jgi:ABC-type siderophore export system fused ATPase/permease subunit